MKIKIKPTVLVVEDDRELAEMYQLQLEAAGYGVRLAQTAQGALGELEKHSIGLIIVDILLAKQNGLSILHELRSYSDWSNIPVIILSNVSANELGVNRKLLRELGVRAYLEKSQTKAATLQAAVAAATQGS